MLFTQLPFWILFSATFLLYYMPFLRRFQISILIVSSLIFYGYSEPALLTLLLFSVFINIWSSYYVVYGKVKNKKSFAIAGVAANLLILCFFKYSPLFSKTFLNTDSSIGEFLLKIPLPVGISFFTFQGISLVIDVYKEKYFKGSDIVSHSFTKHAQIILFFKSFFPQLISGPIVKAHDFLPQVKTKLFSNINWTTCFKTLVTGYFLKMVIADNMKDHTFWLAWPYFENLSSTTLLFMLLGYSVQIFSDFAGYSLIAFGLAGLFGYNLPQNFNFPYISSSFSEFWRRWHISLSSFLKEYLYIPLGGNRRGAFRTYLNLMITMILGGFWHGAAWSYAVWGSFHGLALALERFIENHIKMKTGIVIRMLKMIFVFVMVTLAWLLFKLPDFKQVIEYLKAISNNTQLPDSVNTISYIILYSIPVFIYHFIYLTRNSSFYIWVRKYEYLFYGVMLFLILTNSGSSGDFIYFQF